MPYRLSPQATDDLEALYLEGLASFGQRQADKYIASLRHVLDLIAANPHMARIRTEFDGQTRIHPHGSHMIVYEVDDRAVMILRIRHGRENWTDDPL